MENEKFSFSIGLDNQKALALFGCPVFSGHHFSFSGLTFWNEARSQYPTKFNKWNYLLLMCKVLQTCRIIDIGPKNIFVESVNR